MNIFFKPYVAKFKFRKKFPNLVLSCQGLENDLNPIQGDFLYKKARMSFSY
jgi:hypothetical protein